MPDTKGRYSIEEIKEGFEKFFKENGHYPTALEIDKCEYLPHSRQIQRRLGGLVKFRKNIKLRITDHTRGEARSTVAAEAGERAKKYEAEFYEFLRSNIKEIRIHEHKIIRPGGVSSDFFIYTSDYDGVMIDLFYAKDLHSLAGIIILKLKKRIPRTIPVFLILVGNSKINQGDIDKLITNKKTPIPSNFKVFTEVFFKEKFNEILKLRKEANDFN